MKVLIATHEGQGDERDDYCWAVDGELVTPVTLECHEGDRCGCARGFPGFASSRATTTAMVAERPELSADDLWQALADSLDRQGWLKFLAPPERDELIQEHFDAICMIGHAFAEGTVVRRSGHLLRAVAA